MKFLKNAIAVITLTMIAQTVHADALSQALKQAMSGNSGPFERSGSDSGAWSDAGSVEKGEPGYTNGSAGPAEIGSDGSVTDIGCDAACDASRDEVSGGTSDADGAAGTD